MKSKKLFLIAGSTGGHALPIFDIYNELKNNYQIKIFISGSEIEREIFMDSPTVKIISGRLNRHNFLKKLWGILCYAIGFSQSLFYLLFNRPKLIMAKGGFLAVPVLSAAKILGIPYFTHESDSEMGLTNKRFAAGAKKLFVGFPLEMYEEKITKKAIYSGQIVKKEFITAKKIKSTGRQIFITGGSQGARTINNQIFEILPNLLKEYQIVHQLGDKSIDNAEEAISKLDKGLIKKYDHFDFSLEKIKDNLQKSDLIIGRAGANTIGEIAALSKASILIPYPYAASDHQNKNAKYLEKNGSAIIIKEDVLSGKVLLDRINYLFSNSENLEVLGNKISKAIKYDGLIIVTTEIKKFMEG